MSFIPEVQINGAKNVLPPNIKLNILPREVRDDIMNRYRLIRKEEEYTGLQHTEENLYVSSGKKRLEEFIRILRPSIYATYFNCRKKITDFGSVDRDYEKEFDDFLNMIIEGNMNRSPNVNMYLCDNLSGYSANPEYLEILLEKCLLDFMGPVEENERGRI